MKLRACSLLLALLLSPFTSFAQTSSSKTAAASAATDVPRLVKFSGTATDEAGKPITGVVGVTFALYQDQQGGAPLWVETQNVQADASGHYTAMLGASTSNGVPLEIFSSAEAHWVGTQTSGQQEQARVLLLSVPYALKAVDAETLGGLPASAFIHATQNLAGGPPGAKASASAPGTVPPAGVSGKGTRNFVPLWTGATTLGNSTIFETGGNVGIGTKTPKAIVDVAGKAALGMQVTVPGSAAAINGIATDPKAGTTGVYGQSSSPIGNGVFGLNNATSSGAGVIGVASATSGSSSGVSGSSASTSGTGVRGNALATSGQNSGVLGDSSSPSGIGVFGINSASSGGVAVNGSATAKSGDTLGVYGGTASPNGIAVFGISGSATGGTGVQGQTVSTSGGSAGTFVAQGGAGYILLGLSGSNFKGVFSVDASGNGIYAGNLNVTGKLTKGSGSFKIDHPLDPANKYLSHSFVESPDMMNVYNGVVVLDAQGSAWVMLPDYFEALNRDFRYQLTAIGAPGPNLYIAKKVLGNRFRIAGGKPHGEVSWQVTGIRQDAYANAYRIPTEEEKPAAEQGYYLHPEVFGQPASKSIQAASQKASATDQLAKMSNP